MAWSSAGTNSLNPILEQSNNEESLESSSADSETLSKDQEALFGDQRESSHKANITCEVASLVSSLFELVPSDPTHHAEASSAVKEAAPAARPATNVRTILQHTQKLSELLVKLPCQIRVFPSDSTRSGLAPLSLDGPTTLLLLSSYVKIFQVFRLIFAAIYSSIRKAENIEELLYDLRIEDVILDGDNDLKILVLMQVVTHKLNTLGMQLGIPEKHHMSVGPGIASGTAEQVGTGGHQQTPEGTEPTLDAILSGNETDRSVFWGDFKDNTRCMESAAAAFREELGLLRAQLGYHDRCR